MPNAARRQILKIRCSDGRSRKPEDIRGNFVHEIRLPGGILFPDLCAQHFGNRMVVSKLLRRVMMYAIEVMISLKSPDEVILMAHTHCAAAGVIGMTDEEMKQAYLNWQARLQRQFVDVPIRVLYEKHSECGEHHFGHEELRKVA